MMKLFRKNKILSVVLIALSSMVMGESSSSFYSSDERVQSANQRIRHTLDKIDNQITPNQNIPISDIRHRVYVPELDGVKHRVPDLKQNYGRVQSTNQTLDPIKIAQRYQSSINLNQANASLTNQTDVLVFVSFSMPEASLKRIAAETAKIGGMMIIRGFKDDSLKKTIVATQELAALQGELLIHPELFDHYQITEVPTTVLAKIGDLSEKSCSNNINETGLCTAHYQVKGDISLHSALEYFADLKTNRELSEIALVKLAKLKGY